MLPFLLAAGIVGVAVVFFLPFVQKWISSNETLNAWTANPVVQVFVVGIIVVVGIGIFMWVAKSLKIPARAIG